MLIELAGACLPIWPDFAAATSAENHPPPADAEDESEEAVERDKDADEGEEHCGQETIPRAWTVRELSPKTIEASSSPTPKVSSTQTAK